MPMPVGVESALIYRGQRSAAHTQELTLSIYSGGETLRRDEEQSAEKDDKGDCSPGEMTGGYYWLPAPGHPTISWDVVTCHELGLDAEVGHVEMWIAVIDRLVVAWDKNAMVLRWLLRDRCYGLPRGRVTRPGKRFLILHGGDAPRLAGAGGSCLSTGSPFGEIFIRRARANDGGMVSRSP